VFKGKVPVLYYLLEFGRSVVARIPASVSYPIASAVGDMVYNFWPRGRRNMSKSIAALLKQEVNSIEVRKTARQGMRNYCKTIVDMQRYAYPKKGALERDIDLIGLENMDRALAAGKGAIVVGLHMGNLDLGVRALSHAGYPINAVVYNMGIGEMDRFIQKPRTGSGVKLISATSGILRMLDVLKRNEVIALMIDIPFNEKGVLVKLGHKTIKVPSGMAAMALRTGAKIVPCGLIRSTNTRFCGIVGKPIQFNPQGNLAEDARELTQRTIQALEQMVSFFADQWYIFHPLIKDELNGLDSLSKKPAAQLKD
jgi:phosphatidylinositol dimannoside acyltransferase